jgi:hypothetical protein
MLKKILCGASLLCAATLSNAAVVTADILIDGVVNWTVGPSTTDFNKLIQVQQFDPSLGTLTNVMFTITGNITTEAEVTNRDAVAQPISLMLTGALGLSYGGPGNSIVDELKSESLGFTAAANTVTTDGLTIDFLTMASFGSPSPVLGNFTGPGFIDLTFDASALSLVGGSGNIVSTISTTAGAEIEVKYTYTLPPVVGVSAPSHVALLGLGLLGFAGLRKLRK